MASREWKCIPCGKVYRTSQPRKVEPKCPACGKALSAVADAASRGPTPQPRQVVGLEAASAAGSSSSRQRSSGRSGSTVPRTPAKPRPTNPVDALAGVASSSSAWVPDPEPGPSPDHGGMYTVAPFQPRIAIAEEPEAEAEPEAAARPDWLTSPWTWASVGGVVVALTFSTVFFLYRSGRADSAATSSAAAVSNEMGGSSAAPVAIPRPVPLTHAAQPSAQRIVDLFPLINTTRDALGGTWRIENGALVSDTSGKAKLGIRYTPPREYDFRVQFTQIDGSSSVVQMFTAVNPAALVMGGWNRTISGFDLIAGKSANANPTAVRGLPWENGQRHTTVVRVRKGSIEAVVDGKTVSSYKTDGADLASLEWDITGYPLGVGSEGSSTMFHKIEVVEVAGS